MAPTEGRRDPHLILREGGDKTSYAATVGCNQFFGSFTLEGEAISLSRAGSTRMACPPPLDALERKLGETIAAARKWRIKANTLELFDEKGTAIAFLEAVYF